MKKAILALSISGLLAGCGGDEQTIDRPDSNPRSLTYSYPADANVRADGSHEFSTTVPVSSPVFLRFTHSVTSAEEDLADSLVLEDEQGNRVDFSSVMLTAGNKGVAATTATPLQQGATYTLRAEGLEVGGTAVSLTEDGIVFRTAPSASGPMISRTEGQGFQVMRVLPAGGDNYPITDFTTPRIQLTEPVNESTLVYGDTISLRDSSGELVPAEVYVKDHRITVDPEGYLTVGEQYTLELTDGVKSALLGDSLTANALSSWSFTPVQSNSPNGVRQVMAQQATKQSGEHSITKAGINSVNLASTLLGQNNPTTATGTVFAELAYIPRFEAAGQSVPLSIGRGALMTSESVEVKVAGAVPAGFESEDVYVRFLSDANGFLSGNPYTDYSGAPRTVELYIDMALNTENTVANSALGQELMHVQLVGTAMVENGLLNIEAIGVIEPDVMGVDQASGLISFKLEGFDNSSAAPDQATMADSEPPVIKSWLPGDDHHDKLRPGDNISVFFSEPLLPSSVNSDTVALLGNSQPVNVALQLNGSSLTITPEQPLAHGVDYTLQLNPNGASEENQEGIRDLAGNTFASQVSKTFRLSETSPGTPTNQSPLALTTMPGFPCAKTGASPNAGHQGRCAGGKTSDDTLPILGIASDQPIIVRFSQNMDPATMVAGDSVTVEYQDEQGSWQAMDAGYKLETGTRSLTITPMIGWGDGLYRYTLNAGSDLRSATGLPLQTRFMTQGKWDSNMRTSGGDPMVNYFRGGQVASKVFLPLRNLPTVDGNSDLTYSEGSESGSQAGEVLDNSNGLKSNGVEPINEHTVVVDARVGCPVSQAEDCPEDKFIYMTAMLDTAVAGAPNEDGRIPTDIHPSILATTSSSVWVNIDTETLDNLAEWGLANTGIQPDEEIPTGPMFMRMRYSDDGQGNKTALPGYIYSNDEEGGALWFELELDLYLDAPYLDPSIGPASLEHNLRSYPLDGVLVSGPITFLDDGRMQIALENQRPIEIDVEARGTIEMNTENTDGLCGSFLFAWLCNSLANGVLDMDANTRIKLEIPPGSLALTYLSPNTQDNQ